MAYSTHNCPRLKKNLVSKTGIFGTEFMFRPGVKNNLTKVWQSRILKRLPHQVRSFSIRGYLPSKIISHQRLSSVLCHLPIHVIFYKKSSSVKRHFLRNVALHQMSSSFMLFNVTECGLQCQTSVAFQRVLLLYKPPLSVPPPSRYRRGQPWCSHRTLSPGCTAGCPWGSGSGPWDTWPAQKN